jgi:hypothetical protein
MVLPSVTNMCCIAKQGALFTVNATVPQRLDSQSEVTKGQCRAHGTSLNAPSLATGLHKHVHRRCNRNA